MAAAKQAMPKYRQIEFVVKAYPNSKAAAPKYKNMLIMCLFIISPQSDYNIKRWNISFHLRKQNFKALGNRIERIIGNINWARKHSF